MQLTEKEWRNLGYAATFLCAYGFVYLWCWSGLFGSNEAVYMLAGRKFAEAGFLQHDFTLGGDPWRASNKLYGLLSVPFWWASQDPLVVAKAVRIVFWVPVVLAMVRLSRILKIPGPAFLLGFAIWIGAQEAIGAGEWIFGGRALEQKVLSYGFVFWALGDLIEGRRVRAGLFAGLGVATHLLVGGWSALGMAAAMVSWRETRTTQKGFRALVFFCGLVILCAIPVLIGALGDVSSIEGEQRSVAGKTAHELVVLFRNPHHIDPFTIITAKRMWYILFMPLGAFATTMLLAREARRVLIPFLLFQLALWPLAYALRHLEAFNILILYLFRVGDVVLPYFFWTLAPLTIWRMVLNPPQRLIEAAATVLVIFTVGLSAPGNVKRLSEGAKAVAKRHDRKPNAARLAAYAAVGEMTPSDAQIAVDPCRSNEFPLYSGRAVIMLFKAAPVSHKIIEWERRFLALSGRSKPGRRGFGSCKKASAGFRKLSREKLARLKKEFGATHYLLRNRRKDLASLKPRRAGKWYLYDLAKL